MLDPFNQANLRRIDRKYNRFMNWRLLFLLYNPIMLDPFILANLADSGKKYHHAKIAHRKSTVQLSVKALKPVLSS